MRRESSPLEVDHLSVNYDRSPALWDISFSVPSGTLLGIIGPNGAGKSTLLKAALGIVPALSGTARFFGSRLKERRSRVAYVPQRESVDWDFPITVLELVLMGRYGQLGLFRRPRSADREAAKHYLRLLGMEGYQDRQISQLSGGQQQRAFLARALLQEADLYLMDEPFAGVDAATEAVIVALLKELKKESKTALVVHHDLNTVGSYFDWALLLNIRMIGCGPLEEVFTPENLDKTYGKNFALLDEAFRLSRARKEGEPAF